VLAAVASPAAPTGTDYDGSVDGIDGSVYRLYRAFFLREPDADGLLYWMVKARYDGYPIASIAGNFVGSAEFRSRYGSLGDGGFVDLVYRNVLDRAPDADGRAHWLDQLARGLPRGHLMVHFSDSPEFRTTVGAGPFGARDFRGPAQPAPSAPDGSYRFLDPDGNGPGRPLGWAPCRPVYVVANPEGIPEAEHDEFVEMLDYALDQVSEATGQDWVHVGRTAYRAAGPESRNVVPGVVTVSFMSAPDPNDGASGWASAVPARNPVTGTVTYLAGAVNLNAQRLVHDVGGEVTPLVATTVMHELGHVAGLAHVHDERQLMAPIYQAPSEPTFERFRGGDLAGFARVGSVTVAC